ncbi:MAG: beta-lactamase family protein [Anaerolineae bacterium]|nr:beta-lactamase family protein [Anaerolineae bacterium]
MDGQGDSSLIHGQVAPGFEAVRAEFERNFAERGEIGAACAVYHGGRPVVDLWGGYRDARRRSPWEEDTLVLVFSATKGMAALTLAVAHARGWLDYDARVATYWPEFAQAGKGEVTVRQLLAHQAGLCAIDRPLDVDTLADLDALAAALAAQRPAWAPGTRQGYHALSLGWYEGELLRRVDPLHRSLGHFFQDEIAHPLGIEFYIGLPLDVPNSRLAALKVLGLIDLRSRARATIGAAAGRRFFRAVCNPTSLAFRAFTNPGPTRKNLVALRDRRFLALENPAVTGIGQVRAMARAYSALATGGAELGVGPETLSALAAPPVPPSADRRDQVLQLEIPFSLGFLRPGNTYRFGSSDRAFGAPGAGGSFAFADPDAQIGYAYAPNKMGMTLLGDAREKALQDALYRCVGR